MNAETFKTLSTVSLTLLIKSVLYIILNDSKTLKQ